MSEPLIRPARPFERRTALRLCLTAPGQTPGELEAQVNSFLEYLSVLNLSIDVQFLAELEGQPIAACACILWPGRTGMVLIGPAGERADHNTLVKLIGRTLGDVRLNQIRLHQSLVRPDDTELRDALLAASFKELSVLHYLERPINLHEHAPPDIPRGLDSRDVRLESFDERMLDDWRALVLGTYTGSLDCPGLTGLRHIDDIFAGHRAAGRFSPEHWTLMRCGGRPIAVLMLCENPIRPALELVYTGVHPHHRGRGIGRFWIQTAIATAAAGGYHALTLAVDAENSPARALYDAAGFHLTAARRALIRRAATATS